MAEGEEGTGAEGGGAGDGAGGGEPKPKTYTEADLKGLRDKNAELLAKVAAKEARMALLGDRTAEEVQADFELAAKTREDKAKAEGDFTSLKEQLVAQHTAELAKRDTRLGRVEGKLYDVMARREAEKAIRDAGGNPTLLLPHILPFIKVAEHDEDFAATVVDAKGKPRIADGQGTPMTITQLVEVFKADDTYGAAFSADAASGSGARNSGGPAGGAGTVLIPRDATPQEYRRLKAEAEKAGRPYAVAS